MVNCCINLSEHVRLKLPECYSWEGVGPSQLAEIVEFMLTLSLDFGPISSFFGSKKTILTIIHVKNEDPCVA